jgi:hypothetical protein
MALHVDPAHESRSNVPNELILRYQRDYATQKRKVEEETGVLRALLKRAKGDGINTKQIVATYQASKLDPTVVVQDLRDFVRYLGLRSIPVAPQDLFDNLDLQVSQSEAVTHENWQAEQAGYTAGKIGAPLDDNPYPAGSELFGKFRTGWQEGQAALARQMGEKEKVADASRDPPGRGGGSRMGRGRHGNGRGARAGAH